MSNETLAILIIGALSYPLVKWLFPQTFTLRIWRDELTGWHWSFERNDD